MRCRTARGWITRDLAGELSPRPGRTARAARRGLRRLPARADGLRSARSGAGHVDRSTGRVPPRLEQDTLRRVRLAAADDDGPRTARRLALAAGRRARARRRGRPAAARCARVQPPVAAGQLDAPRRAHGACEAVPLARACHGRNARRDGTPRRSMPSQPPPELAARPDLFVNLPDAAQHGEAPALRGHPDHDARRAARRTSRADDVPALGAGAAGRPARGGAGVRAVGRTRLAAALARGAAARVAELPALPAAAAAAAAASTRIASSTSSACRRRSSSACGRTTRRTAGRIRRRASSSTSTTGAGSRAVSRDEAG